MSPVTSFEELMAEQARAAVKVTGAHHSSWNKSFTALPPEDKRRGIVKWDHTIQYHPQHVIEVLQEMFEKAGQLHDDATLRRYREVVRVMFHENVHLLAAAGTSHAMAYDAYQEPAVQVVEEGGTEAETQNDLNAYIDELGLEAVAPGITTVRTEPAYGQFLPAVKEFADAIGRRTELQGEEVIRRLAGVNAEDKLRVAAVLVYASSSLPDLVPEPARAASVDRIVTAMKGPFAAIHDYDAKDPADVRMSALAGTKADRDGYNEVRAIAEYWSNNQDLRRSLEAGLGASTPIQNPQRPTNDQPAPGHHSDPPSQRLSRRDQTGCRPIDRSDD